MLYLGTCFLYFPSVFSMIFLSFGCPAQLLAAVAVVSVGIAKVRTFPFPPNHFQNIFTIFIPPPLMMGPNLLIVTILNKNPPKHQFQGILLLKLFSISLNRFNQDCNSGKPRIGRYHGPERPVASLHHAATRHLRHCCRCRFRNVNDTALCGKEHAGYGSCILKSYA